MFKNFIVQLLIFSILAISFPSFAQDRGIGVKVKKDNGKTEEIKLYDGSYALIIGESNYTNGWDNLPGVKTDVIEIKQALEKSGFMVESEMDLTSDALQIRINRFIRDYGYGANNRILIYFAGHGYTQTLEDGREIGYIVPVDATNPEKDGLTFKQRAIPMSDIQSYATKIQSKHALFIFDSCFSGSLISRELVKVPPLIREDVSHPVRQFITSGAANQKVPDDSIFRKAFVRGLTGEADLNNDGYITGTELAEYLKAKVTNASDRAQTPQYAKIRNIDLERGDFVFVSPRGAAEIQNKGAEGQKNGEVAYWQIIENSTEELDFQGYLSRIITGEFSGTYKAAAELKITKIRKGNIEARWGKMRDLAKQLLKYDVVDSFIEGLAKVRIGDYQTGKVGFIDQTGKEVIPLKYDDAWFFTEGLARVKLNGKLGFIDKTGKEVIPFNQTPIYPFSDGLARFKLNNKWGFIDQNGKEILIVKKEYDNVGSFYEGLARVKLNNKFGFIDKTGKEVIPLKYDSVYEIGNSFTEGLARVELNDKFGFIDKTGKEVVPLKYDFAGLYKEGLARVSLKNKRSFIDQNENEIILIEKEYDNINSFSEGLAKVELNGKFGYIDKTGKEVIPLKYDEASDFSDGLASVKLNEKVGLIDKTGREIIPIKYEKIWSTVLIKEGFIGVVLNGKKGFVDIYGNEYK